MKATEVFGSTTIERNRGIDLAVLAKAARIRADLDSLGIVRPRGYRLGHPLKGGEHTASAQRAGKVIAQSR